MYLAATATKIVASQCCLRGDPERESIRLGRRPSVLRVFHWSKSSQSDTRLLFDGLKMNQSIVALQANTLEDCGRAHPGCETGATIAQI